MVSGSTASANRRGLFIFIGVWVLLNGVQAYCTNIEADEAYYWLFSRNLDWGYFDHPPFVALSVKAGEIFGHGSLFTRLGTVFLSAGSVYFGYLALPGHLRNTRLYVLCFASIIILNVYGFIVTPDASLLFFTALFFYCYRLYLDDQKFSHVFLLAISIAGLLYSKYQGVLPVFFTFLSNPKLALKRSAWMVVLIAALFFLPHLWWQQTHGWPTVQYHLFERGRTEYKIEKTTNYILGQLLIWGPLTTLPALWLFRKLRTADLYLRAHLFVFWGVLLFFLLTSFKKNTEPQWTLPAAISFITLMLLILMSSDQKAKLFSRLFLVNIILIVVARLLFMIPNPLLNKVAAFHLLVNGRNMVDSVRQYTGETPVAFVNSYQLTALYSYYFPSSSAISYNTVYGRKNHFNISGEESKLNGMNIFSVSYYRLDSSAVEIKDRHFTLYVHKVDSFRAINSLRITLDSFPKTIRAGENIQVRFSIKHEGHHPINATGLYVNTTFFKTRWDHYSPETKWILHDQTIMNGFQKQFSGRIQAPAKKGKHRLIFSVVQPGILFGGSFASRYYDVVVE